jgi:hypothetical protein
MIRKFLRKLLWGSGPTLKFRSMYGPYHLGTPVVEARRMFPHWMKQQIAVKNVKFAKCPGMFDLAQQGFLVVAPYDIHIRADKWGVNVRYGQPVDQRLLTSPMDYTLVDGLAPVRDDVARVVIKIPMPWMIISKPGYSAHVLPALMHSPFLGHLHVYPGIVDYEKFHVLNFVVSPLESFEELTIWAGTPLLQIIPFQTEAHTADVAGSTQSNLDHYTRALFTRVPGFYRKVLHQKKSYRIINQPEQDQA